MTDKGLEIRKLDEILVELQGIARRKFADLVSPEDPLDVSSSSILGRVLGITAETDSYTEELLLQIWQSLDPEQAESVFLDKILALVGIYRKGLTRGYVGLMLQGDIGKTIYAGAKASSKTTGVTFETTTDVTFSNRATNGVTVKFGDLKAGEEYVIGYSSVYSLNTYPSITVIAQEGDTVKMLATRAKETVLNSSKVLDAYVDLADNLVVSFKNKNTIGDFIISSNATILDSFMPVSAVSEGEEAELQASNTITLMQTSSVGWSSVTNPFESIPSKPEESDLALRRRARFSRALRAMGNKLSMYAGLYETTGVEYVNIKENISDNPSGGRSAKGIAVIVYGGDEDEIAKVIEACRPLGCVTDGKITKTIYDDAGATEVSFSRPEVVPLEIRLSITTDASFPQNGRVLLQEALVRYIDSLEVGDNVVWSKLFNPINEVKGVSVNSLTIGLKGTELQQRNVELAYNQLASLSFENIKI